MVERVRRQVDGIVLSTVTRSPDRALHPPVVLLPGTGATASDWDVVADDLGRDRVVHAVDQRGHGESEWPGTYSIDLMAADLTGLLAQLPTPVDLVGHSLGGLVACRALAAGAPSVRRLVLEDVGVLHPRAAATPTRPEGPLDLDWAVVEQVRPEIDSPAAHWPDTLARVWQPTLGVSGGARSFVRPEDVAALAALVHDGRHVVIDAGHEVHGNEPEAFLRAVRAFLDD
ncbi:MAG: putative hydrolase [Humibacillus sp.]|nr:putative hydrolase [Humibacillus sp.]